MTAYGNVAVQGVELFHDRTCDSPGDAWDEAARTGFPHSVSQQKKSCPRGAFLGLCEEGLVAGIPVGSYPILAADPQLADAGTQALWRRVLGGRPKQHDSQMKVVLGLHRRGLLVRR